MSASITVGILALVTAALRCISGWLGLRTRPSARQRAEKAAHDARAASAKGDAAAVNAAAERARVRRALCIPLALLLLAGCIPLPVPVVSGAGGDGWSGWRVGLSWGAAPAAIEIPEKTAGGSPSCGPTSCSEGGPS
ncbi:MAG TPA: hypothetical protein PLN93_06600 [Vicinamibacterales bacterium]|nr:hypothetical protein [Vicinamibacterales bacterium]